LALAGWNPVHKVKLCCTSTSSGQILFLAALWWQNESWKTVEDLFSSGKFLKVAQKRGEIANLLRQQICLWTSTLLHNDELPLKASLIGCNISHPNACTIVEHVSVHYRCAHGTPNVIHTLVKVWAKILSPNSTPTHIVSSYGDNKINSWSLYTRDWKLMTIKKNNSMIGAKCNSWSIVPEVYFTQGWNT